MAPAAIEVGGTRLPTAPAGRRWAPQAAHPSSAPHRALSGTPAFLHPHTARHRPGDTHTAPRIWETGGQATPRTDGAGREGDRPERLCHAWPSQRC